MEQLAFGAGRTVDSRLAPFSMSCKCTVLSWSVRESNPLRPEVTVRPSTPSKRPDVPSRGRLSWK